MVTVSSYSRDSEFELILKGHATGSPEVCAGLSAIVYALAGWIENNREHIHATPQTVVDLRPGDTCIFFHGDHVAAAAYQMAEIGIAQLAKSCAEYFDFFWPEE